MIEINPLPCFYWRHCRSFAAIEKGGKSVCAPCGESIRGVAYPLRPPTLEPLYPSGRAAAEAMDMIETNYKQLNLIERLKATTLP